VEGVTLESKCFLKSSLPFYLFFEILIFNEFFNLFNK